MFALAPRAALAAAYPTGAPGVFLKFADVSPLDAVSQLSGGMVMDVKPADLNRQLAEFVRMARGRYIVEFGRPRNNVPGDHEILVTIAKSNAVVRPAGVSMSIPDPNVAADPDTIPRDVSDAPEMGRRRRAEPPT